MLRVAAAAALLLAAFVGAAGASDIKYVNARFGTVCVFPAEVFSDASPEPENGDGQQWLASDGASLICSAINNIDDATPKGFVADAKANQEPGTTITYSKTGRDWAVLSGFKGPDIFYERHLFAKSGVIHSVWIEYPAALKTRYDPLVGTIAGSLRGP